MPETHEPTSKTSPQTPASDQDASAQVPSEEVTDQQQADQASDDIAETEAQTEAQTSSVEVDDVERAQDIPSEEQAALEQTSESSPNTAEETEDSEPAQTLSEEETQALALEVEAAILTTDRPISPAKLAEALSREGFKLKSATIKAAVDILNELYDQTNRSFRIELVANGYRFMTLPKFAKVLASMKKTRSQNKLSPSALETLAVVAYKQPIVRAEVEAVRGVACGETLRSLMERGLVKIVGRSEDVGRPMLYGTTPKFLEIFGLAGLNDLPKAEELRINN